jgi:anti-sigma regulatory factor (Ser/Thr protein kinase)
MRVETTRSAATVRLEHAAGFHASTHDLLDQLEPLAEAAIARGEPVVVALAPATERSLAARLADRHGTNTQLIPLSPADALTGVSAQTTANRWALELRALTTRTEEPLTVFTEHLSHLDGADGRFWTELDAALNIALADLPVRITCFYPQLPLHLEVLDGARYNHPLLLDDGHLHPNPRHRAPNDVLAERRVPAPPLLGPPDVRLPFSAWQLHDVRSVVQETLAQLGCTQERIEDIVLAVNEVATNAVEHGTPEAQLSLWTHGPGLLCEIDDGGTLRDPLPGLRAPHPSKPRGRGLWIARQLCDSLHIWSDECGTHVRMCAIP